MEEPPKRGLFDHLEALNDEAMKVMIPKLRLTQPDTAPLQDSTNGSDIEQGHMMVLDRTPDDDDVKSIHSAAGNKIQWATCLLSTVVLILGILVSFAFVGLGLSSALSKQESDIDRAALDVVTSVQRAWDDYVNAAGMIHGRCRTRDFTRADIRLLYEYLVQGGLDFQAAQFDPNITHAEREFYENEAREYYAEHHPTLEYRGFIGFNTDNSTSLESRLDAPFYFPIHYMEPIVGNEAAIDLDYHASGSRKKTVLYCMEKGLPALTDRLRLVQETAQKSYGVVLMHPGYNVSNEDLQPWPRDLASIVIRIPDLLKRSVQKSQRGFDVYLYDQTNRANEAIFLGGTRVIPQPDQMSILKSLEEVELTSLNAGRFQKEYDVAAANKIWTILIQASSDDFPLDYLFIVIGGTIILSATLGLAAWVHYNTKRIARLTQMKADVEAERSRLILESAKEAAKAERELNDFLAHEVRNPVAAAMSACSFVKTALHKRTICESEEAMETTKQDVYIIDNALKFVNDILRNMLDMHRTSNKQLIVHLEPTDLLTDILEPVQAILTQRDGKVEVLVDCEEGTFALADRLRLKQVVLNLGRNSAKFVSSGFIRLCAKDVGDRIEVAVEDSGPGIPTEKRKNLFKKYQESLDLLSQGTGIGLYLCKGLSELMDGDIHLDEDFHSGIAGQPGSRFVVSLKKPDKKIIEDIMVKSGSKSHSSKPHEALGKELPEQLSVLFVDDDPILRKLFSRTVRTVAPNWTIREASNGETALKLVEEENFDLIFMDMYMAAVEKQLLGTETVEELRARGVTCRICGLSANDKEMEFLEAGADCFSFKPFACEKFALRAELRRILYSEEEH